MARSKQKKVKVKISPIPPLEALGAVSSPTEKSQVDDVAKLPSAPTPAAPVLAESSPQEPIVADDSTPKSASFFKKLVHTFHDQVKFWSDAKITINLRLFKKIGYYVLGVIAIVAILIVVDLHSDGRTYPRSWAGPIYLGYLKPDEVQAKVNGSVQSYLTSPLSFILDGKTIPITPQELGLTFRSDRIVNTLPIFRFTNSIPANTVSLVWENHRTDLQFAIDGDRVLALLQQKFDLSAKRAHNAQFIFQNKKIVIQPEASGHVLDRFNTLQQLEATAQKLSHEPIQLRLIAENPDITSADLVPQQGRFTALLEKPLHLWKDGKKWKLDPAQHLEALTFEQEQSIQFNNTSLKLPVVLPSDNLDITSNEYLTLQKNPRLALNADALTPFLNEQIIASINRPASDVKISQGDQGQIVIEGKGQDGLTVPPERLLHSLALALNQNVKNVQIPVFESPAKSDIAPDLQALGIRELISTGHTTFYGSPPNRVFNIQLGIQKYNGLLIKPGETFSFNKYIGQVDARSGFLPEKVIKEDKIELEFGGGICQVSTTAYRAALLAGLPIRKRAPHSIKVAYYAQVLGPGLDATIYPGSQDLQFTNDTPGYILMQSYEEDGNAYFKFYGTNDGRKVQLDGPYGGGLHYEWFRNIIKQDGTENKETILSNYKVLPPPAPTPPAPTVAQASVPANAQPANPTSTKPGNKPTPSGKPQTSANNPASKPSATPKKTS